MYKRQIKIQASGGLSDADIQKMVKDAEAHAAEDKKRRELVDARNHADGLIHTTERTLKEAGDKIASGDKTMVEKALAELKAVLDGDDLGALKAKTEALAQVSMKLGEAMYKAGQAEGGDDGAAGGGQAKAEPGVVDADYEEVDDNKKKSS